MRVEAGLEGYQNLRSSVRGGSRLDFVPQIKNQVPKQQNVQQILGCHGIIARLLTHCCAEARETKTRVGRIEKLGRCHKERNVSQVNLFGFMNEAEGLELSWEHGDDCSWARTVDCPILTMRNAWAVPGPDSTCDASLV